MFDHGRGGQLHGAGTCTIDANQAGNGNWAAAPQMTQSFIVGANTGYYAAPSVQGTGDCSTPANACTL